MRDNFDEEYALAQSNLSSFGEVLNALIKSLLELEGLHDCTISWRVKSKEGTLRLVSLAREDRGISELRWGFRLERSCLEDTWQDVRMRVRCSMPMPDRCLPGTSLSQAIGAKHARRVPSQLINVRVGMPGAGAVARSVGALIEVHKGYSATRRGRALA